MAPTPPVTVLVTARPAASEVITVLRVEPLAVSSVCASSPNRPYWTVLVTVWAGLAPPPVMSPAGAVRQSRSAHSGRPAQGPVPVAVQ